MVYRRHVISIVILITIGLSFAANAQEKAVTDRLNEIGISGKLQILMMRRQRFYDATETEPASGTIAATLNYQSPVWSGFSFAGQYVHTERFFNGGNTTNPNGEGYDILNDDFSILNRAYVEYNFEPQDLKKTYIRVGRQTMKLDFFQPYPIRQKDQAFEGVLFRTQDIGRTDIYVGHIDKFSSWSPRTNVNNGVLVNEFIDVEKVGGVPYKTEGMSFFSATCKAVEGAEFTVYDFYGYDLYNTLGAKVVYKIAGDDKKNTKVRVHYISQRDTGDYDDASAGGPGEIRSDATEIAVSFFSKKEDGSTLLIEPGVFLVAGSGAENNVQVPFRTSFVVDPELMWYTDSFAGGSATAFVKTKYTFSDNVIYVLYAATEHEAPTRGGAFDQEFNVVLARNFTKHCYASVKLGYGYRNNRQGLHDTKQTDFRIFLGYKF